MSDQVTVSASRLAHLERIAAAAGDWWRAWTTAQTTGNTVTAFDVSKQLAAAVQAAAGVGVGPGIDVEALQRYQARADVLQRARRRQ